MDKIDKVEKFIEKGKSFLGKGLTCDNSEFKAWNNSLIRFIEQQYGQNSTMVKEFKNRIYSLRGCTLATTKKDFIVAFEQDLHTTLEDLQYILEELKEDPTPVQETKKLKTDVYQTRGVVINNINTNTISNYVNNIADIKNIIENSVLLNDKDKTELIQKLDVLDQLQKSNKTKTEKWKIAKEILRFIIDKGVDIAIMFLPQILKALQ